MVKCSYVFKAKNRSKFQKEISHKKLPDISKKSDVKKIFFNYFDEKLQLILLISGISGQVNHIKTFQLKKGVYNTVERNSLGTSNFKGK